MAERNAELRRQRQEEINGGALPAVPEPVAIEYQRMRVPKVLPAPPPDGRFRWAKRRREFRGVDDAELVVMFMRSPAWEHTVGTLCDAIDAQERRARQSGLKPGGARAFTSRELESVELYRRAAGLRSTGAAIDRLTARRGRRARQALGFDRERRRYGRPMHGETDGVPSESALSRHRARFAEGGREAAYEQCFDRILEYHLSLMGDELLFLTLDGTDMPIHATCPKYDRNTGQLLNEESVTCWSGGYRGGENACNGFKIPVLLAAGFPLSYDVHRANVDESVAGKALLDRDWEKIRRHVAPDRIPVASTDTNFKSNELRDAWSRCGVVPITALASGKDTPTSRAAARKRNDQLFVIRGYEGCWYANGHREIFCHCGRFATGARVYRMRDGRVNIRVEGRCPVCGPV